MIAEKVRLDVDKNHVPFSIYQDKEINKQKAVINKGFSKEDGVFVQALDAALSSFNVERQAYHGGSFVGNHIHQALKVNNYTYNYNYLNVATKY